MKKEDKTKAYRISCFYKIVVFALIQIPLLYIANKLDFNGAGMYLYALSVIITIAFCWWVSKESKKQFSESEQVENAKELVKEGKFNFVVKRGILYFGLPMAILMYFFNVGLKFDEFQIILNLIIFTLAGTAFGLIFWWLMNKKLKKK